MLLSAVGAYAAQQKYYFLYEEGHEDQPETSWFILDREAKKYIPDSCGDDELTVKNYKKSGNTETFDCYDNSYFTHSVVMKKNDKGQTVVQISYEKGKTNGRKIVCGTEAEYDKYWEEYRAKNGGGDGGALTLHVEAKEVSWHLPRRGEGHITLAYTLLLGTQALSALRLELTLTKEERDV